MVIVAENITIIRPTVKIPTENNTITIIRGKQTQLKWISHVNFKSDDVLGIKPGRTDANHTTFFKSVGNAVQDAAAAQLAMGNASKMGLGKTVPL